MHCVAAIRAVQRIRFTQYGDPFDVGACQFALAFFWGRVLLNEKLRLHVLPSGPSKHNIEEQRTAKVVNPKAKSYLLEGTLA